MSLKRRFMNMAIRNKMITLIYSSVFVMVVLLTASLIFISENHLQNLQRESRANTASYINLSVANIQKYIQGFADYCGASDEVQRALIYSQRNDTQELFKVTAEAKTNMDFVSLVFYDINGFVINSMSIDYSSLPIDQIRDGNRPFSRLIRGEQAFEWEFIDRNERVFFTNDYSPKICLWQVVKNSKTTKPIGVVAIAMDTRKLVGGARGNLKAGNSVLIMDRDGTVILNHSNLKLTEADAYGIVANILESKGNFIGSVEGNRYRITYEKIFDTKWYTFVLEPYLLFTWNSQDFVLYILFTIALFCLLLLPILAVAAKALTEPVRQLTDSMNRFSRGYLDSSVQFQYEDEIGQLGRVFNHMVSENRKLIEQTYILKLREQEAALSLLQSQINPHFLYNLINTIHWKALRNNDSEVAEIAYSMGRVFRITLSNNGNMFTIRQEKELIAYYLKLQKVRYKNRIEYELDFSEDILDLEVPRLLIQPLVENAVVHGAEKVNKPVHIRVIVRQMNNSMLTVRIHDDGAGIPDDILVNLNNLPRDDDIDSNRFAIRNIHDRLHLYFGEEYEFQIKSQLNHGTDVWLTIPASGSWKKYTPFLSARSVINSEE